MFYYLIEMALTARASWSWQTCWASLEQKWLSSENITFFQSPTGQIYVF